MKHLNYIILIGTLFFLSCNSTKHAHNTGKYQRKVVHDERIAIDKIGIKIQLFDIQNGKEIAIDNVKNLPGQVIDSTANSKLLVFSKDSVPNGIFVDKPKKMPFLLRPGKYKKNLIIFKIYLTPDIRGVI